MITGVSTASMFMREMNEDALTILNELGVECTEIFLATYSEYSKEFATLLKQRAGALCVNSVHLLNTQFEPQLFSSHERARKDAYDLLNWTMKSAKIFGAKAYTFHGISRLKKSFKGLNYAKMGKDFNEMISVCKKYGISLCLENVHWATYAEPGIFKEFKKYCPDLKGVFDIKQARLSEYPYGEYISDMEGCISHVHLSDYDEKGDIRLPSEKGKTDFCDVFKRLKDAGFDGAVIIEVYPNDYKEYIELKRSCDYLNEIIYKIY